MNNEETNELLRNVLQGAQVNQLNIVTGDHAQVVYNGHDGKASTVQKDTSAQPLQDLKAAVASVQAYMWGKSAYAVLFGVCRDYYHVADNMTQFEKDMQDMGFDCPAGTIGAAFYNNSFLKLPVEKWSTNGAKPRVLTLVDAFKNAAET